MTWEALNAEEQTVNWRYAVQLILMTALDSPLKILEFPTNFGLQVISCTLRLYEWLSKSWAKT